MESILDEYSDRAFSKELYESIKWWEKRRIYFNILVGISGLIPLVLSLPHLAIKEIIGVFIVIFVYGFFVNMCYCFGWASDILKAYYYKTPTFGDYRSLFFGLGLIFSMLTTFWLTIVI